MSERNTGYQFVSTDTEAVESLLISIYEKITGVSVKPASPEKLFIQFVAAVVIQERGLNNYTGNQNTSRLRSPTTSAEESPLRQPRQTTSGPTRITTAVSTAPPSECRPAQ